MLSPVAAGEVLPQAVCSRYGLEVSARGRAKAPTRWLSTLQRGVQPSLCRAQPRAQSAPACRPPPAAPQVGARCAWFVRLLMLLCAPVAWPLGKLLDALMGGHQSVRAYCMNSTVVIV